MEVLLALLRVYATSEPTITAILPIVERLIAGETMTSKDQAAMWTAVAAAEDRLTAQISAKTEAAAQAQASGAFQAAQP